MSYCNICDVNCCKKSDLIRHETTKKHIRNINKQKNVPNDIVCTLCDYKCCKQSVMNKHLLTNKHIQKYTHHNQAQNVSHDYQMRNLSSQTGTFSKCSEITPDDYRAEISELKNFILEQSKEHKRETLEIINKIIDMTRETSTMFTKAIETVRTTNNTINQNNNKSFNINLYLNEQCKDAINFSDFINNIEVSREDLENNAQLGFVGGISKIIVDNLKELAINERPVHCTDLKRETMYIKDDNKWTKEENFAKLNKAIQTITCKSVGALLEWKKENPDYKDSNSEFSGKCIVIQQQSMACHNRDIYYPKVIHVIAKETFVDK